MASRRDIQIGEFAYSSGVVEQFRPRHRRLHRLYQAAANKTSDRALRSYVTGLMDGWMEYLNDDEAVLLSQVAPDIQDNGKRAEMKDKRGIYTVRFNFVNNPRESGAQKIELHKLARMSYNEKVQFAEQHPEVLSCLCDSYYDAICRRGVMAHGFALRSSNTRLFLPLSPLDAVIVPKEYVHDLDMRDLLDSITILTEDSDIISLDTGRNKGEICLKCQRVDP